MGMLVDLRIGESVLAEMEGTGEKCVVRATLVASRKPGTGATLVITAPASVTLYPPSKQKSMQSDLCHPET